MKGCFYFVVDRFYLNLALLQAHNVAMSTGKSVYVFVEGVSESEIPKPRIDQVKLLCNLLSSHLPAGLPATRKWPQIVYLRIFAPLYLQEYDRAVYLDADVALVGDAQFLFKLDMAESPVAAIHDTGMIGETAPGLDIPTFEWLKKIGLKTTRYFNSGVLVINVQQWLKVDFSAELQEYYLKFGAHARMWDQDFLNYLFQDSWIELSPKWNFQITLFNFGFEEFFEPAIVHFTDGVKPWHLGVYDLDERYPDLYVRCAKEAGIDMASLPPTRTKRRVKAKWFIRRHFAKFGFISKKQRFLLSNWNRWRNQYINFFIQSMASGKFADIADRKFVTREVQLVFNGRVWVVAKPVV